MLLERYTYKIGANYLQYRFDSEGPRGKIGKMVLYTYLTTWDGISYYNLGFGDYDDVTGRLNDLAVSDNGDRDKILMTVALTALEFTSQFPDAMIVIRGSTSSRTRLYQMGIARNYREIAQIFDIQGVTMEGESVPFRKGENYRSFLASRK
ncbi:MAG TPA: hypothetical protein VL978_06670 [Puia sp.]|nr:hypothetical protein [Puia sp.]